MKLQKLYSDNFNKKMENYVFDNKYEYKVMRSICDKDFYGKDDDNKIIQYHINHISSDYLEDDGFETIISNGFIKDDSVICELLMRRLK